MIPPARRLDALAVARRLSSGAHGFGSTAAANGLNLAMGVITGVLTARLLHPAERGALVTVIVWTSTIATLALVGLNDALVHRAGGSEETAYTMARLVRHLLVTYALIGLVATAVADVIVTRGQETVVVVAAVGCSLMAPSYVFGQMRLVPLRISGRFGAWNALRLVPPAAYLAGVLGFALVGRLTLSAALVCLCLSALVLNVVCWRLTKPVLVSVAEPDREVGALRSYGLKILAANVPTLVNQRLDQLLLGLLADPQVLGVYAVAVSIASVLQLIGITLEQILFPKFAARRDREHIRLGATLWTVCAAAACVSLLVAALSDPIIRLVYGEPYTGAVGPLRVLVVGVVIQTALVILTAEAKAQGRIADLGRAQVVGAVVAVVMVPLLIHTLGIMGAAIGSTLSYAITTTALALWRRRSKPLPAKALELVEPVNQSATPVTGTGSRS